MREQEGVIILLACMILGQIKSNCEAENSQILRTFRAVTLEITFDQATATPLKVTFRGLIYILHRAFHSKYKFN